MYFGNYGFRKTLLEKCLKSRASEDPSTSKIINGIKQCGNMNDTSFTIFLDQYESN